ncbi:uncharacterized protein LOC142768310 [Rhipicephalus microplus]|uniref:uncharacterized protein LOC142768310 n=1 Tax=Rhipicephalus microplus TaxID=6941 RepID=UPI003F6D64AF
MVKGDPAVAATDDSHEVKPTTSPPAAPPVSTTPRMGGSPRVTVQSMSTTVPTARPSSTTSPLTMRTTTATTPAKTTKTTTTTTTTVTMTTTTEIPGPVKAIICTVGETARTEEMYPSEYCDYLFYTDVYARDGRVQARKDYRSWILFQNMAARYRNTEFGISFSFDRVDPESLDESAAFLDTLRNGGIKHYGLLTVLTFQSDYNFIVSSTREIIAGLSMP